MERYKDNFIVVGYNFFELVVRMIIEDVMSLGIILVGY